MSMLSSTVLALQGVSDGYRQIDGVEQFALLVVERSESALSNSKTEH
jgi:hypothetical protein